MSTDQSWKIKFSQLEHIKIQKVVINSIKFTDTLLYEIDMNIWMNPYPEKNFILIVQKSESDYVLNVLFTKLKELDQEIHKKKDLEKAIMLKIEGKW